MLITMQNKEIKLTTETRGAQMMSLTSCSGLEYLWQGDPKYWPDHAPTLFPFIGRLTRDSYQFRGTVYPMHIHGFASGSEFEVEEQAEDRLVLLLKSNPETKKQYPFDFELRITLALAGSEVRITYAVQNLSEEIMPFGIGGHPGFRVPLEEGASFEDYVLDFKDAALPDRVGFSPRVYLNGHDEAYPLEDGRRLCLRHDLFDEDAVILKNMSRAVTLHAEGKEHGVTVSYPEMSYLGIWHLPKSDAPYVCIEPWTSLPSRDDVVEEFSCKSDMVHLLPGKTWENSWSIAVF